MAANGSPRPHLWPALFLAAVLCAALVSVAQAEPQGPPGFNGIPWGAPREGLEHFAKLKQRGNAEFYLNTQENFEFEGFPQPRIIYGFIGGRLYGVYVDVATQELFDSLLQRWTREYGEPRIVDEAETYVRQWRFEHLKVKLKRNKRTEAMKLAYYFLPLYEHVELAMDQGAEDIDEQKLDRLYWLEMMRMRGTSMP